MALQVIRGDLLEKIDQCVDRFVRQSKVKCALVADNGGQLIMQVGFTASLDLSALAALIAGIFAAGQALAKLLGESRFVVLYHEGRRVSIFFCLVGRDYIFVSIFDERTNMGVVQLYAKDAKEELGALLKAGEQETYPGGVAESAQSLEEAISQQGGMTSEDLDAFLNQDVDQSELFIEEESPQPQDGSNPSSPSEEGMISAPSSQDEEAAGEEADAVQGSLDEIFGGDSKEDVPIGDDIGRLFDGLYEAEDDKSAPKRDQDASQKKSIFDLDGLFGASDQDSRGA